MSERIIRQTTTSEVRKTPSDKAAMDTKSIHPREVVLEVEAPTGVLEVMVEDMVRHKSLQ
jgi:hypothetical protein